MLRELAFCCGSGSSGLWSSKAILRCLEDVTACMQDFFAIQTSDLYLDPLATYSLSGPVPTIGGHMSPMRGTRRVLVFVCMYGIITGSWILVFTSCLSLYLVMFEIFLRHCAHACAPLPRQPQKGNPIVMSHRLLHSIVLV